MGASEHDMPLGNRSPPSSPSSPSDDSTLYGDQDDAADALSEHENAFLDHSRSLLDQEYDYQRQLITHYSKVRSHTTHSGYPPAQTANAGDTGQPSWSHTYGKRSEGLPPPGRIYTGMDDGAATEKGYAPNAYAYQYHQRRRPLVGYVTNRWRTTASSPPYSPTTPVAPSFAQIISAPKLRRYLLLIIFIFLLPWTSWKWYGRPWWEEHKLLNDALDEKLRKGATWYGLNLRPVFMDMVQLETLDVSELPDGDSRRRLIFIGDVHGCSEDCQSCPFSSQPTSYCGKTLTCPPSASTSYRNQVQ